MKQKHFDSFHFIQLITQPYVFPINAYLLIEENSCTLIDCSKKGTGKKIIAAIKRVPLPLKNIVITHLHSDHVGDLIEIHQSFPEAKIAISSQEWQLNLSNPDMIHTLKCLSAPRLLVENDRIGSLVVIDTPGHTYGSISLIDQRTKVIFIGDAIQTQGGFAIAGDIRFLFPFPAWATQNKKQALKSFEKLLSFDPKLLCSGHGNPIPLENPVITAGYQRFAQRLTKI